MWILISALVNTAFTALVVEYRFGHNFGQVFRDYSDNNRYGVNGDSSSTTAKDAKMTDRGAYFDPSAREDIITMPPNDVATSSYTLGSTFVVLFWILPLDNYNFYIYNRKNSDSSIDFSIKRIDKDNLLQFTMTNSGGTFSKSSSKNALDKRKI